jgi:hypothetical protein
MGRADVAMGFDIHALPDEPERYRIFKDGDAWCAVGREFVDPQSSITGWGDTPDGAYLDWCARAAKSLAYFNRVLALLADFELVMRP